MDVEKIARLDVGIKNLVARFDALCARVDAEFNEADHPRGADGKFGAGGGAGARSEPFKKERGAKWVRGSNVVPDGAFTEDVAFPLDGSLFSDLKKSRHDARETRKNVLVPVDDLHAWQNNVEPGKLRPIEDDGYEPIKVYQINGKLVIGNGNHRAASAFVQGLKYIKADVISFDDKINMKHYKEKKTSPSADHPGIRDFDPGIALEKQ